MAISFTKAYCLKSTEITLYVPGTPFTPKGTWNNSPAKRSFHPYRYHDSSPTGFSSLGTSGAAPYQSISHMLISPPLAANASYSGTFQIIESVSEDSATGDCYWAVHIWVSVGDTDSVRATLLSNYLENTTGEFATTATGASLQSPQAISGSWQEGDRIIIELGMVQRHTGGSPFATFRLGSNASLGDLAAGEASATKNPTVTFSNPIDYAAPDNMIVDNATVISSFPFTDSNVKQAFSFLESGSSDDQYTPYSTSNFWAVNSPVWYKYVATFTGNVYISVEGSPGGSGRRVSIWENYTASQLKDPSGIADAQDIASMLEPLDADGFFFPVVSGNTYYILCGFDESGINWPDFGDLTIKLDSSPFGTPTPPANATCSDAELITLPYRLSGRDTRGATETRVTNCGTMYNITWYKFVAATTGFVAFHTGASAIDNVGTQGRECILAMYQGIDGLDPCTSLVEMKCAIAGFAFPVIAGKEYFIAAGSAEPGGYFYFNLFGYLGMGEYHNNFNQYQDTYTLFGGDWYEDQYTDPLFGDIVEGWGPDGSQAVASGGPFVTPLTLARQTNANFCLLPFATPFGIAEADVWLAETDEIPAMAGSGKAWFQFFLEGTWDVTNRSGNSGDGTYPDKPENRANANAKAGWIIATPWTYNDSFTEIIDINESLHFWRYEDNLVDFLDHKNFVDLAVDVRNFFGWHRWKIKWRNSTYINGVPQPDGVVELWIDDTFQARACDLMMTTDLGDGLWNGFGWNPHGALDNVDTYGQYDLDESQCPSAGTFQPCLPATNGGGQGASGTHAGQPPTEPFEDSTMTGGNGSMATCVTGGTVPAQVDPNAGESWCE